MTPQKALAIIESPEVAAAVKIVKAGPQRNGDTEFEEAAKLLQAPETAAAFKIVEAGLQNSESEFEAAPERGSFEERFRSRRVDLRELLKNGVPPIEYLPASEGMYVRGKRHLMPAPRKMGKSFSTLRHSVEMVLAGARVVILDRENGAELYATRLGMITAALDLTDEQLDTLHAGLVYYEFPQIRPYDHTDLTIELAEVDLVVFDSSRRFLADLGLDEDSSDDYARFMAAAVDPLFEAGIATLIQDNTGHQDATRSRGSSAKADLNEIQFVLEPIEPFSTNRVGKIRLRLDAGASRFGNEGTWDMTIGAGVFGPWERVSVADEAQERQADARADMTEWIIRHVHQHPEGAPKTATVKLCHAAHEGASRSLVESVFESLLTGSDPRASRGDGKAANAKTLYPALQQSFPLPEPPPGTTVTTGHSPDGQESFPASHTLKEGGEAGSTCKGDSLEPPETSDIDHLQDEAERLAERHPDPAAAGAAPRARAREGLELETDFGDEVFA